jgi:Transglutaminase-like superfamily/TgpA N-terminal domain
MDTWVDRTVQLRAKPRTSVIRNYTFEITAALCVALIAATAWAVLAAGWVNGGGGAAVVAVTSVIEAALLAQARAPRLAAAIAAPFLGLAAIVPTTLAALPPVPGQTAGVIAGHYAHALFTGLASTQDWDFTVGLCAILFLCGYWLGWTALREHRGILAVVPIFSVLATNVVNAKNPDLVAVPETVSIALALAVIAAAYLGSLGDRWSSARITALDGLGWRFSSSAAGVVVVITILALVLPPATTTDVSSKLFPNGLGIGAGGHGSGPKSLGGAATIGFNPSVELGGPLVSQPKLVMTYTDNTNASVYLRVEDDTQFDDGNWFPQSGGSVVNESALEFPGGLLPRDLDTSDGGVGSAAQTINATIVMQKGATGQQPLVPFTGDPASVDEPGLAYGTVSATDSQKLETVDSVQINADIKNGTTIQTSGYISTATEAQLRAAGTNYPAWTQQFTTMLDDGSQGVEAIRTLAQQWTSGDTNPYDEATAIQNHLRDPAFFQYTLNPPQDPSQNTWPVVWFLTQSHKGYCQYFASAMGSLLRTLKIPTRLVTGYGPGTTRTTNRPGVRQQTVSTSDAHSWVEAYFPNYGWIPFEPTPPSQQGNYSVFPRGAGAVTAPTPSPGPTSKPLPTSKPGSLNGGDPTVKNTPKAHASIPAAVVVALATLAVILVLLVGALLWLALPRSLAGVWRRVETLGVVSGVDRRRAETHRAFAARLARARPRAGPALAELAVVTAQSEFSPAGASRPERAQALRTWRRALFEARFRARKSPG